MSIPSPRPADSSRSSASSHVRRPSIPISPSLSPRVLPVPVPQRHGSMYSRKRPSVDAGSFGSVFLSSSLPSSAIIDPGGRPYDRDEEWLNCTAGEILRQAKEETCPLVPGEKAAEEAVDVLLKSGGSCLLVQKGDTYGFFDLNLQYSDLNAFLLLVLQASGSAALDPRSHSIATKLRKGIKISIGDLCDLSQKSPYHSFQPSATMRTLLPLFASGVHRVAIPPLVLTETSLLQYLLTQHALPDLNLPVSHPTLGLSLSPVVSLSGSATVLDAMQVMSVQGLGALGVTIDRNSRSNSNSSSSSSVTSSPDPFETIGLNDLLSVVTARDCTSVVVPSEGKQALGMGLELMVKALQIQEPAGQARGEERFPVHTITPDVTLQHASHLVLATASSRVFVRRMSTPTSPPVSPLNPPSPTLSLSDLREALYEGLPGLPPPPPTQLSTNQIISISDILSSLAKRYSLKQPIPASAPQWDLDPASLGRRRRLSTLEMSETMGLDSWRWAR